MSAPYILAIEQPGGILIHAHPIIREARYSCIVMKLVWVKWNPIRLILNKTQVQNN